ncbi:MAG: bifunctional UDP-N-acetylglucosamine diphosphorylase/glucosamine-1-phosphate N-acetyltransferase GlmU [Polyangiaceae bacterium]
MTTLSAIVLAAGEGKRMKSSLTKVLHPAAGRPLIYYPVRAALDAGADYVVVVLSPANREAVEAELTRWFGVDHLRIAVQQTPRGTGDAARAGLEQVDSEHTLVLCGDTPLLGAAHLTAIATELANTDLVITGAMVDDPTGYGRVLRDAVGRVTEIREHRDLQNDEQRAVKEINAGVYAARVSFLRDALARIVDDNAQGELYLTDTVAIAAQAGSVVSVLGDDREMMGVNDRAQLAQAAAQLYERNALEAARAGASVELGARIDSGVQVDADAVIRAGATLRGKTRIFPGALVDTGAVITDSDIGPGAVIKPHSVILESKVGPGAQIGPFAHLRPASVIEEDAHIGNFVETKKTVVRKGAKANHLAYLGDGDIGEKANVGAGTIFCNYDGFRKHKTTIGPGAFIGSDSQIVAPVTIGSGAYVATGTTVTKDVPNDALAIGRIKQENKLGYASRLKARLSKSK